MTPNKNSNSQERRLSPELQVEIQSRLSAVNAAADLIQASLAQFPNILPTAEAAPKAGIQAKPNEVAASVIDLAARKEQRQLSEHEQYLAELRRQVEEVHNDQTAA